MTMTMIVPARAFAAALLFVFAALLPARAMDITEVRSPAGVTAWLVEDYTVPIVTIRFSFAGGSTQDPVGKEGLANLMTGLFDEGAGDLDSEAFQLRLDDVGLEMGFSAGRDTVSGSARILGYLNAYLLLMLQVEHKDGGDMNGSGQLDVEIEVCWCYSVRVSRSVQQTM